MLYLQIASPKSSVLNFLDSNSFEVIISIFQRTEKVPDMERLLDVYHTVPVLLHSAVLQGLLYVYKKSAAYNFSVICSTLIILLIWNMAYLLYNTLSGHGSF